MAEILALLKSLAKLPWPSLVQKFDCVIYLYICMIPCNLWVLGVNNKIGAATPRERSAWEKCFALPRIWGSKLILLSF